MKSAKGAIRCDCCQAPIPARQGSLLVLSNDRTRLEWDLAPQCLPVVVAMFGEGRREIQADPRRNYAKCDHKTFDVIHRGLGDADMKWCPLCGALWNSITGQWMTPIREKE